MRTQFSAGLRLARRKAGYTQEDIAHLLAESQSQVCAFETGRKRPDLKQIIDLSLIYARSFESFFAELLLERQQRLLARLDTMPEVTATSAQTFNRPASLQSLQRRLKSDVSYGSA